MSAPDTETSEKPVVTAAAGAEATLLGTTITCPVCGTENAPSEKYCGDCGFLLSSTPGEVVPSAVPEERTRLVEAAGQSEYFLQEGESTVGREAADVLLGDATVSRRHALLVLDAGKVWVEDLNSTNGTYVDGKQIQSGERMELADGAELKFGSVVLKLVIPSPSPVDVTEAPAEESPAEVEEEPPTQTVVPTEVAVEEIAPEEKPPVARLVSTADPSTEYAVMPGTNTIGRRAGNDIQLVDDPYVSGSHAEIIADERGFWLVDVGSTNGTMLNGSKINANSRMALNDGDEVVFGQTTFRFEFRDQESEGDE